MVEYSIKEGNFMYFIKSEFCEKLIEIFSNDFPKRRIFEEYMNRSRKAQENTVRALAAQLGVDEKDWKELVY